MIRNELRARITVGKSGNGIVACGVVGLVAVVGCAGFGQRSDSGAHTATGVASHTFAYASLADGEIQILELDETIGDLTPRGHAAVGAAISSLAGPSSGRFLAAVSEKAGTVTKLGVNGKTGALNVLARSSSGGARPGQITADGSAKYLLVSNQTSGNVAMLALRPDGAISPPEIFPAGVSAFGVAVHPSNTVAFVASPRADSLAQFAFNEGTGMLTPKPTGVVGLPAGSNPLLVACHPNGRYVYVLNQGSDTISVHTYDDRMGTLTRMAFQVISTLPAAEAATMEAAMAPKPVGKGHPKLPAKPSTRAVDLVVAPSGRFVYALNRANDSLVSFAVDLETGGLTLLGHMPPGGQAPIDMAIDPTGAFLVVANQASKNLAVFRLDPTTGQPTVNGNARLPAPPLALHLARPAP